MTDRNINDLWFLESIYELDYHKFSGVFIDINGNERHFKNGKLHREDGPAVVFPNVKIWYKNGLKHNLDQPAYIANGEFANISKWYKNGKLHRENDKPAIEDIPTEKDNGMWITLSWYQNGELHRENGPAVLELRSDHKTIIREQWYFHGSYHRKNGPAIVYENGSCEYYSMGQLHRIDGPAIDSVWNEHKEWWVNGKRHRINGPVIEWIDRTTKELKQLWAIDDKLYTEEEFKNRMSVIKK